jgi:formate-nitrite transporter family protein
MSAKPAPLEPEVDHVRGPEGARVVLVYGDFECPYTRVAYRKVQRLERRGEQLRFAFRHFPLTQIHPHALDASLAAEGAADQGLYWPMHDALFHGHRALEAEDLRRYAREVGAEVSRFQAQLASGAHIGRIQRDVETGSAVGVRGTPTIFVDGERYEGDLGELPGLRRPTPH